MIRARGLNQACLNLKINWINIDAFGLYLVNIR